MYNYITLPSTTTPDVENYLWDAFYQTHITQGEYQLLMDRSKGYKDVAFNLFYEGLIPSWVYEALVG